MDCGRKIGSNDISAPNSYFNLNVWERDKYSEHECERKSYPYHQYRNKWKQKRKKLYIMTLDKNDNATLGHTYASTILPNKFHLLANILLRVSSNGKLLIDTIRRQGIFYEN
jgi:hypothetical protein